MKPVPVDSPAVTDAAAKQATGKTLQAWFADLDAFGGVGAGRRALIQHIHAATGKNDWWATTIVVEYEKARGALEKDGAPKGYSICCTKTIAAPVASVFAAFGDAGTLNRWLGPKTQVAFEEGGLLRNGDGNRASFTRIRAGKDLRLDWDSNGLAAGSKVEVLFADKGKGKTGITLNHLRIQERRDADVLRACWGAALDVLKAHMEGA
jgi:uncharacterized protein YndB with AHSA1/START domain